MLIQFRKVIIRSCSIAISTTIAILLQRIGNIKMKNPPSPYSNGDLCSVICDHIKSRRHARREVEMRPRREVEIPRPPPGEGILDLWRWERVFTT